MKRYSVSDGRSIPFKTGSQTRAGFLDETRGFCIILMVLYHTAFNVIYIFGWDITLTDGTRLLYFLFNSPVLRFAQPFVAGIFIFISGIVCRYSRSNLKRGLIALALGFAITAFTFYFMPEQAIFFGILHFLGSSMILFAILRRTLDKIPPSLGLFICLILFALTLGIRWGFAGVPGLLTLYFPASWAQIGWLIPLGFAAAGADHFPLLPWLFLFLAGSYLGVAFISRDMPYFFYRNRSRFLATVGRRAIIIYVLHQPVVFGVLYGISLIVLRFSG